jgi:hypothetical protein
MTVAAVVPTYNRARLIGRALTSILDQEGPPDEIIVVDDGSTDDTEDVVKRYGSAVRYVRQSNAGASVARNTGVALAEADYVAFLDSDDLWMPGHVETLASAARATHDRATVYFADCYYSAPGSPPDADHTLWELGGFTPSHPFELSEDPFPWSLLPLQPTMLQSSMIARRAYFAAGGLDPKLLLRHDTGLFFSLALGSGAWCAVNHVGTRMTAAADNRLTGEVPTEKPPYWDETVLMYREILGQASERSRNERNELRSRLAVAHWRLARLATGDRRLPVALTELRRAVATSPATVAGILGARVRSLRPAADAPNRVDADPS